MDNLTAWLTERQPDIVCLQETKCVDDAFPREPLEALGYNVAVHGQKAFNGVAVLSKFPLDEVTARLPGDNADDHARFMEIVVSTAAGAVRVASIYLPNGNPPETEKYSYKIKWMENHHHVRLSRVNRELFSTALVFLDDLLCQVVLISDFIDLVKLSLNPIYMFFLIHNNVLQ